MTNIMNALGDLVFYLKFGRISKEYFGFSPTWIYQRLGGKDGNGNPCEFTQEQRAILKEALHDVARKINAAADKI